MDGSSDRIERLYELHIQETTRVAFLLTGNPELAEDLAQDAFVKATARFQHLRSEEAFGAYLMRTVVNACKGHWRHRTVERRYLDRAQREQQSASPEADVPQRLAIIDALGALTPRQRAAVVLRHYADLPETRAAELMGCTVGTVKTLSSRGLAALRERMKP